MLLSEEIVKRLEQLRQEIRENMERADENASGRTSASFAVESEKTKARLVGGGQGCAPLRSLEIGVPPTWVDVGALYQWSIDKGLRFSSEEARTDFAFALRWKIAERGTNRHRRNVDIYTSAVDRAIVDILEIANVAVTEKLQNELKV